MPKALFNLSYTNATPPSHYTGERRAEYIAQRNFYNLTAEYNYFSYVLNGEKVVKNATAEHYFTREGTNTGLFNMSGPISEKKKEELKELLRETKSPIWHGFISFDAETSLGFQTQEKAVAFMKQTFGGFLQRAGFDVQNVELYCSLHEDTEHRHIHFAFFEREPLHYNSKGEKGVFRRGLIGPKIIDNYLVSANMHLSEHAADYYTARDRAVAELRQMREVTDRSGIFTQGSKDDELSIMHDFSVLIKKLPQKGRLQYNAESMAALRPEIDALADRLIRSDPMATAAHVEMYKQLARIKKETEDLARENKLAYVNGRRMTKTEIEAAMGEDGKLPLQYLDMQNIDYFERLQQDYRARLGNVVLGICKDMMKEERRRAYVNDKHLKIEAKNRRARHGDLFRTAREALAVICQTENANFLKTVKEIERENEMGTQRLN